MSVYSVSDMFLLPYLLAVILFLNNKIFLWECSYCPHLIWQNLMVSAKHLLIVWYFTEHLSGTTILHDDERGHGDSYLTDEEIGAQRG